MSEKSTLEKAAEHIRALEEEIERLSTPPLQLRTVLKVLDDEQVLGSGDAIVKLPPTMKAKTLKPGTLVTVNGIGAIVDKIDINLAGMTTTVKRVFDGDMMEIEGGMGSGGGLIFKGLVASEVKPGDLVQLDRTGSVALKIVPKDKTSYSVETATGVCWDDIGGQEQAKAALREAVEGPIKHSKLFKAYGKSPLKGVLLSGPPGCGKTMLAKAVANSIREAHGADESSNAFIYVKGPEVLNMWVGNTESQIRGLFARAREHKELYGYPAVIFIDEADAILGKRGSQHGSVLSSTIVPTFLAEMDGLSDSGAFVLLATNRQDILDPAIVREGRIDRKVVVSRPEMKESAQILKIHLLKTKVKDDADELAGTAAAELFSDSHLLYRVGLKDKGAKPFHVRHLVSGAMLAGVVDMATSIAIRRDSEGGKERASGLIKADIEQAVVDIVKANRNLNHDDALESFAETHGAEIEAVQRVAA